MSVVDKIQHYQRSLERCTDNGTRTLHCIEKLYRLPVTVQHLQETGVGRTVNALRKYDGSIGDAAKALVAKWKTMVVDEDTSDGEDEDEACVPDAPEGYSDHSNSPKPEQNNRDDASRNPSKHKSNESRDKSRGSEKHDSRHGTKNSSSESAKSREKDTKQSRESNEEVSKCSSNGLDKKRSKSEDKNGTRTEKNSKSGRESKNEGYKRESSRDESSRRSSSTSNTITRIKSEDERKSSSRVSSSSSSAVSHGGTSKNRSISHDSRRKRKTDDLSSERETSKRKKTSESSENEDRVGNEAHDEEEEDDDDIPTQVLSRDSDNEIGKVLPDTSFGSDSDDNIPSKKIKRETTDSPTCSERGSADSRNAHKNEKTSKSKTRNNSEKSRSDSGERSKRDSEKRDSSKSDRNTSEHRKSEKRKEGKARISPSKEASSKSKSQSGSSSSSKDLETNKDRDDSEKLSKNKRDSKLDGDSKESREKFKEPKDKKGKKKKLNKDDGIDCNSGASFAEALGMCQDRPSSRKKNPVSPTSPMIKTVKAEPGTSSASVASSSKSSVKVKSECQPTNESQALSLLAPNVKLEPLNVDLAATLPEISPNYKPLPAHYASTLHRKQDEEKALSDVIYTKGQRTKVYSGNKSGYSSVPTLCEVCIRVLIQHMDALGFTGGIPYDILKPVLERAMPDQLFTLENYNPYLIEDTDSLWQFHCNREFREKQREEMESWRDMYMRCRDEREIKFRAITANIKESIDKSVPVRSTKLAYVDNIVKPPRNVLRNQAKYGTARCSTSSSDLKKKLILSGNSKGATNISVPPPPMSRMKPSSSSNAKKNKAPLMAKALQLIKSRYKR